MTKTIVNGKVVFTDDKPFTDQEYDRVLNGPGHYAFLVVALLFYAIILFNG